MGSTALGQPSNGRFEFEFDRVVVTPLNPEVTLMVLAAWDEPAPELYAFTYGTYDLVASSGDFTASELHLVFLNNTPGVLNGRRVDGAAIGQIILPGGPCGGAGCPPNPQPLAEYTWTTTDFSARTVNFETEGTTAFTIGQLSGGPPIELYPQQFTPGFGSIRVVPAPPAAMLVAAAGLCCRRRSR
jgi:hypothetical protein